MDKIRLFCFQQYDYKETQANLSVRSAAIYSHVPYEAY